MQRKKARPKRCSGSRAAAETSRSEQKKTTAHRASRPFSAAKRANYTRSSRVLSMHAMSANNKRIRARQKGFILPAVCCPSAGTSRPRQLRPARLTCEKRHQKSEGAAGVVGAMRVTCWQEAGARLARSWRAAGSGYVPVSMLPPAREVRAPF